MFLKERFKLARSAGTAPYALSHDHTIKRIALTRPYTKARLDNINDMNQHLVTKYGDLFLQAIQKLSQELNKSLDGAASLQSNEVRKTSLVTSITNKSSRLTLVKFEVGKMWHEDRLSVQNMVNFPRMTQEIKSEIQGAILNVESVRKRKLIKNELPEIQGAILFIF